MKCDELRIENACVYGPDAKVYLAEQVDEAIAELKDKCQMHDFFWEGCGFAKRGFKNTIAVSEEFDRLKAENRRLRRALWLARAERAKAMYTYWHVKCIEGHLLYEHKWIVVERLCRAKAKEYK